MNSVAIRHDDDLAMVAFRVCTAFNRRGMRAVLTGGAAATVYAPDAYQSTDADFILLAIPAGVEYQSVLRDIGYEPAARIFKHPATPFTVDIVDVDIRIGSEVVDRYATRQRGELLLHILTPTDCVRDRLAGYYWYKDLSALQAACAVALQNWNEIDLGEIERWSVGERELEKFEVFRRRISDRDRKPDPKD